MHWYDTPCDLWTGRRAPKTNYGVLYVRGEGGRRGRQWYAHRWAWTQANGPIPPGLHVLHHCDNPPCREIEHLFLGTNLDNHRDCIAKGRRVNHTGAANRSAKLTDDIVREARHLHSEAGLSLAALAQRYGVAKVNMWKAISGRTWRHVR